jgi:hypothetical protein
MKTEMQYEYGSYITVHLDRQEISFHLPATPVVGLAMAKSLLGNLKLAIERIEPCLVRPGMTEDEAKREAIRRWGRPGPGMVFTFDRLSDRLGAARFKHSLETVGRYWVGYSPAHHGNGESWEEAFANLKEDEI